MPKRRLLITTTALLLLALPGCGLLDGGERPTLAPSPSTTTAPNPQLIDTGSSPRTELRLQLVEGATTTAHLRLDLDVTQSPGPTGITVDSPVVDETVQITVDEVGPNDAAISFRFTAAAIDRFGTDLTDEEYLQMVADLEPLIGLGGSGRVTDRGTFTSWTYDLLDTLDPTIATSLRQFQDQIGSLAIALPTEPLGVGASWRTRSTSTLEGIQVDQVSSYRVTAIDAEVVSFEVTSSQRAAEQPIDPSGLPAGTSAVLRSADISGTGSGTLDLGALVATSETTLTGRQVVAVVSGPGAPEQEVTQQVDLRVSVTADQGS